MVQAKGGMFVTKLLLYELVCLSQCGGWEMGYVWGMLNMWQDVLVWSILKKNISGDFHDL